MPLFHDEGRNARPSIHALVIGVGGYAHLAGGTDPRPQVAEKVALLKQLTSPPRSALEFAEWLRKNGDGWNMPLDTIDLLISPVSIDPIVIPTNVLPATIANIQNAFTAWRGRCDANADNVALFYYCGHGVEKSDQYLLAEDFGANPGNPWTGAFAFDRTRLAFHECKARTQWFFVDACRRITSSMLVHEPEAGPLALVNWTASECDYNLIMKAAVRSQSAFGPKRGTAYFTRALIRSLEGAVAVKNGNGWVVETGQIVAQINKVLGLVKASEGYTQRCTSTMNQSVQIRSVPTPTVRLVLDCNPASANQHARLTCEGPLPPDQPVVRTVTAPWNADIAAGTYRAEAVFPLRNYKDAMTYFTAYPPSHPAKLECV
jgi:hypothetical protein